jgi:hypothetical protein
MARPAISVVGSDKEKVECTRRSKIILHGLTQEIKAFLFKIISLKLLRILKGFFALNG